VTTEEGSRGRWWKRAFLTLGALIGATVIWGWLSPEPESEQDELTTVPAQPAVAAPEVVATHAPDPKAPTWVHPTILWTVGVLLAVIVGLALLGILHQVVTYLVLALFFSFALEPAVNYMHDHWHWKRGIATGLLLVLLFLLLVVIVLVFVPTVLQGAAAIADRLPSAAANLQSWAKDTLGVDVATSSIASGGQEASVSLTASSHTPVSALLGFATSLIGGVFGLFTVAMFIFYMVAEASQFRRAVLSFFPEERQQELLSIWEAAIEKTGGYFYSRLLLATINGGLFYIVLRIEHVPGAAPLALFEGTVAAFIPIVGTYIAATVPIVTAFISVGSKAALVLLIYVLIYQQVENYLLSPRIQGRTMQLHPAVAFGAALAGGAIGGLLWAFLALPFAATVQASASLWVQRHEVVESNLTRVEPVAAPVVGVPDDDGLGEQGGRFLRSTRGWLRKVF
jgi:predicted PurR-regulated permease PerM